MAPRITHHAAALIGSTLLVLAASCDQRTPTPSAPVQADHSSLPPNLSDYVATPAGWYHRTCVHEVPNGAHVDIKSGLVTRTDGTTFLIPKCQYPAYPHFPTRQASGLIVPPTDNSWIEDADDYLGTSDNYAHLAATWRVPAAPAGSYSGTQVFYSFPGLEDIDDPAPAPYIIQPVIQYGSNGQDGGSYWTAASWRCNYSGGDCLHGTYIRIYRNDVVDGTVDASNCTNGKCTWTIVTNDTTQGIRSNWTATDTENYNWTTGGAVEVYGLNTCDQYPDTGVFFTGVALYDINWSQFSPGWYHYVQPGLDPSCGFNVASTASTVSLFYNQPPPPPPLTVSISGPSSINTKGTYTWTASPSGGNNSYSYQWSVDYDSGLNEQLGTAQSQSLTVYGDDGSFTMDVTVTSGNQQASASEYVINCINGGSCQPNSPPVVASGH